MTETQPNLPLIIDTFAHIELDRNHWNQTTWGMFRGEPRSPSRLGESCGTSHCFAGWAVSLSGEQMVWSRGGDWSYTEITVTGQSIDNAADRLLGINGHLDDLYDSENSLTDLYSKVARLVSIKSSELRGMVITRLAEIVRETREEVDKLRAERDVSGSSQ